MNNQRSGNTLVNYQLVNLELDEIPIERALGLLQNPLNDLRQIKAVNKTLPTSKRGVLSFISSIFDPLGMLAPATLEPKVIIQELWKQKLDWEEELNSTNIEDWQYVPTKSNAVDYTNRYIPACDLNNNSRWFKGPDFIYNDSVTKTEYVNCNLEENSNANVNLNKIENEVLMSTSVKPIIDWNYYSSLTKIDGHLAWILKLKGN